MTRILRFLPVLLGLMLTATGPAAASPPAAPESNDETRHRMITSSDTYMPLPPLLATLRAGRGSRGVLQIEAGLEISDSRLRDRAERFMPRLRNAYVSALSLYTGMHYSYDDVPDADRIAAILQEATDMTLGQDGADVLIGMIIIHAD